MIIILITVIYLSFISLGLPDAVLGSSWNIIAKEFNTSISNMGILTIIISAGTIISSLNSDLLIKKLGVHKITSISIFITAISMLGFALSPSFLVLCLWAIPYGLGAGNVDAALNNYVAINFESKHMSWLHCMWGIGATLGPYIMSIALINNLDFRGGYIILFLIQIILATIILVSYPVWKIKNNEQLYKENKKHLKLNEVLKIKGVLQIGITFFFFCSIEQTTGLWASNYLIFIKNVSPEIATGFTSLFYLGITIGRGINGFFAMKFSNTQMIRFGSIVMLLGVFILFIPSNEIITYIGLAMIGLGSSPIYPSIIHSIPIMFGVDKSQSITGVQMASAYTGTLVMPALFGIIGNEFSFDFYPVFITIMLIMMIFMYEKCLREIKKGQVV